MEATSQSTRLTRGVDMARAATIKQRLLDQLCVPTSDFGNWIARHDVVLDEERRLRLADQGRLGVCRKECGLIVEACHRALAPVRGRLQTVLLESQPMPAMSLVQAACSD